MFFSISRKILFLVISTLVLVTSAYILEVVWGFSKIQQEIINFYEQQLYSSKKVELQNRVEDAIKIIDSFYQKSKKENIVSAVQEDLKIRGDILLNIISRTYEENHNKISQEKLLKMLKNIVKNAQYGKNGYFWIHNLDVKMVMHPFKPSLDGKDLSNFADPTGKKLFSEMVKTVRLSETGTGFVQYKWNKPNFNKPQEKISYVFMFQPLGWVIGTGVYLDSFEREMKQQALKYLSNMRYGDKNNGYFWIHDLDINMVMHPLKPALDGKSLSHVKDPNDIFLFREMKKKVDLYGSGFVEYKWLKSSSGKVEPKLSYVQRFREWGWVIGTGAYITDINTQKEIFSDSFSEKIRTILLSLIGIMAIMFVFSTAISRFITKKFILNPIQNLSNTAKNLVDGDGDLTKKLIVSSKDELSTVSNYINQFIEKVRIVIEKVRNASQENLVISTQLKHSSNNIKNNVEQETTKIKEIYEKSFMIKHTIRNNLLSLSETQNSLKETQEQVSQIKLEMSDLNEKVIQSSKHEDEISQEMRFLLNSIVGIHTAIEDIKELSIQTDLLALNAAIEASKAGEQGKGFAVVAESIRTLAENTQENTNTIENKINKISKEISNFSSKIEVGAKEIKKLLKTSDLINQNLEDIMLIITDVNQTANYNVENSEILSNENENIVKSIEIVNQVAQSNLSSLKEIDETVVYLYSNIETLDTEIKKFKIE
jgi:methyl-accepting chemotaxis protein